MLFPHIVLFAEIFSQVEEFPLAAPVKDQLPRPLANGQTARRLMNGRFTNREICLAEQQRQEANTIFGRHIGKFGIQHVSDRGQQVG